MNRSADILIVTVNRNEAKAVLEAFASATRATGAAFNEGNHTYHDLGTVNGQQVVMVQSEMGSVGLGASLQTVQAAVVALRPSVVIMVGVAFGMTPDKQVIGQVLVASRIMNYEPQRVGMKDGKEQLSPRGTRADVSTKLLNHLRAAELRRETDEPKVSFGLIISGEKLVDNSEFLEKLRAVEPEAIGGEMEGAGLYAACQIAKVDWILVKAICDWGDGKKDNPNKEKDQQLAARNSATFIAQALQLDKLMEPKGARQGSGRSVSDNSGRQARVTILVRGNRSEFGDNEKRAMLTTSARLAGVEEDEVEIITVEDGSIIVTLRMPMAGAERLRALWMEKPLEFLELGVFDLKVEPWRNGAQSITDDSSEASPRSSSSGIRDNYRRGTVAEFLNRKIRRGSELSVVSAYFTIYAFDGLKSNLTEIERLRFLFGEPQFIRSLDPSKTQEKAFRIEDDKLELKNRLEQKRVARECADWIEQKVEIRSVTQAGFLHGKMYHIHNAGVEDAILGSSNFTVRGLGLAPAWNNIELNLEVDSNRDRRDLKAWFDELWNDSALVKDVKAEVLSYLEQLYQNHPPEFIYYKTLFHIFDRFLGDVGKTAEELGKTTLFETGIWKALFEFQKDGVKGAINKVLTHNGCILADSVGLGKTYEALAVIKYFELRNERVLVLCPKKLRENWTVYKLNDQLNPFGNDRFRYDVLSHTDLCRDSGKTGDIDLTTINWGNYDLVVIDESHNFRNNTPGKRDEDGNLVRKSRYERLMDDIIKAGVKTKMLLVSATPVNNDLKDLRNQIYFLTEGSDTAFKETIGIANLKETLRRAQANFSNWARQHPSKRKIRELLENLGSDFFKLLDELTIARSRKHIQKYYAATIKELGGFPIRAKPVSITPDIDLQRRFLSYDKLNQEISGYKLSLFSPSAYVREEFKSQYQTRERDPFTQADRENFLIGMMKVNFLKRLESSVESFEITMERTIQKIEGLERKIANFKAAPTQNPDSDELELELGETGDDEDRDAAQLVGGKFKYELKHLKLDEWLKNLKKDKDQLTILYNAAKEVTPDRDAKLSELKTLISKKVKQPTITKDGRQNRKVLVFTAFSDTAAYLYDQVAEWAQSELGISTALVTGSGNNCTTFQPGGYHQATEFNHILTNFSPIAKHREKMTLMPQAGEIDLLIATDCISEGQNLQDCDYLINYDIHWNPVRIIQRFGRIDRIGSRNQIVQLVNFWPTDDLNQYINLKHRVEARMALVDIAATFEDNVLKTDDLEELIQDDLKYRDKQLLRLKDEILDMDELNEDGISLSEFTLDDFRIDLLKYLEANRALLEAAPFGLYTVVPPNPEFKVIAPGVVFCLKQTGKTDGSETINPLQPYFLVYIRDDGNVRFTFAQPKQILDIYRILCAGKTVPDDALCQLFDTETDHGKDMNAYSVLLQKALESIVHTFRRRATGHLLLSRDAILPTKKEQATEDSEFELITWLVIKTP